MKFVTNKSYLSLFLIILSILMLFCLSNVSAASYNLNNSSNTGNIQDIIDNDYDEELTINLDNGNYNFSQINLHRNAIIQGKSKNGVKINSSSLILFNIMAPNVIIRNLTIINLNENGVGIRSSVPSLTVSNCNITTAGECILMDSNRRIEFNIQNSENENYRINSASDDAANLAISYQKFILIENNTLSSLGEGSGQAIYIDFARDFSSENLQDSESRGSRINSAIDDAVENAITVHIIGNNITSANSGVYVALPSDENLRDSESRIRDADMASESNIRDADMASESMTSDADMGDEFNTNGLDQASRNVVDDSISFLLLENNKVIINGSGFWLNVNNANITNNTIIGNWFNGYTSMGILINPTNSFNFNVIGNNIFDVFLGIGTTTTSDLSGNFIITANNIEAFIGINPVFYYQVLQLLRSVNILNNIDTDDAMDIINKDNSINLTINYNRIVTITYGRTFLDAWIQIGANSLEGILIDLTGYGIMIQGDYHNVNYNFDYNWWGTNDLTGKFIGLYMNYEQDDEDDGNDIRIMLYPESNSKVIVDNGIMSNKHYILKITNLTSLANVFVGDKLDFALLVLNDTLTNEGVENLPNFVIEGTINNATNYIATKDNSFVYQLTVLSEGLHSIDASLDDAYDSLEFNASKRNDVNDIETPNGSDDSEKSTIKNKDNKVNVDNTDVLGDGYNDSEIDNKNNGSSNTLIASAAMENTGIPVIAVLLVLLSALGVLARKRY